MVLAAHRHPHQAFALDVAGELAPQLESTRRVRVDFLVVKVHEY